MPLCVSCPGLVLRRSSVYWGGRVAQSLRSSAWHQVRRPHGGGPLWPGQPWWRRGVSGVWHSPSSYRPSLGQAAGVRCPIAEAVGGASIGAHHQPHSARSCELALLAVGAEQGRDGGGASCFCEGFPELGLLPPPTANPWGRQPGPRCPFSLGAGDVGVGSRHQPDSSQLDSCELTLSCAPWRRHYGALTGAPRASVRGVRGLALSLPQSPFLGVGSRGLLPLLRGRGSCGRGDPSLTPQPMLLRARVVF